MLLGEVANNITSDERRKELETILFADDPKLKKSMLGYIGALKNRIEGKAPAEVQQDFWQRYTDVLSGTQLDSNEGREYVRLRIDQWY